MVIIMFTYHSLVNIHRWKFSCEYFHAQNSEYFRVSSETSSATCFATKLIHTSMYTWTVSAS